MSNLATAPSKADSRRLTREDWLDAAFDAAVENGFEQVRVLPLAEALGVTRGSFYWHFSDHAELIAALLERWRQRELAAFHQAMNANAGDAEFDLLNLLDGALARGGGEMKDLRFGLALRAYGRRDEHAAKVLAEIDRNRLALFTEKFRQLTGEADLAAELASLFYMAVAGGVQAVARPSGSGRTAPFVREIIAKHLVRRQRRKGVARQR